MIDKNYNLSCYALEHPFQAYYSHLKNMIELIDINNEIFQFRLPDIEHYDKVIVNNRVKKYQRIYGTTILLYHTNQLCITNNEEQPQIIENIEDFSIFSTHKQIHFLLKPIHKYGHLLVQKVSFLLDEKNSSHKIHVSSLELESSFSEIHFTGMKVQDHSLKLFQIFGQFCLFKNESGVLELAKLHIESHLLEQSSKSLRYQFLHHFSFPPKIKILGTFKQTFIYVSLEDQNQAYFCDPSQEHHIISLKDCKIKSKELKYLIFDKYLMFINDADLIIFQTICGTCMAKLPTVAFIEQFQVGSAMMLGIQHQEQFRFFIIFDELPEKITYFYLMDKEKLSLYHINITKLLDNAFLDAIKSKMEGFHQENEEIHKNVIKTVNFRLKKLQTLQQYVNEGFKIFSFGNVYRFLQNQSNVFVMSDGLFLFYNSLTQNQERIMKERAIILELQREIMLIIIRLVNESKYENHIGRGLTIANTLFSDFRTKHKLLQKKDNFQVYLNLLESKRVVKLLKQDKNKKLFELSYELAIGVKGYNYLQEIEKGKK